MVKDRESMRESHSFCRDASMKPITKEVLLIEDDLIDVKTVQRATKDLGLNYRIVYVKNGQEALDYLTDKKTKYPHFILLDINMPIMNGIEFLEKRKEIKALSLIPVVVLTTSKYDADRLKCFKANISGYMVKPVDYQDFVKVMKAIDDYWSLSEYTPMNS